MRFYVASSPTRQFLPCLANLVSSRPGGGVSLAWADWCSVGGVAGLVIGN